MNKRNIQPSFISRSLAEGRALLSMGIPIVIGHFAIVGMSLTDTVLAGHAGVNDLAGLAVAVNLWIPLSIFLIGILTGIVPLTAQYRGENNEDAIQRMLSQGVILGIVCGLLVTFIIFQALPLIDLLGAGEEVSTVAKGYLYAIGFGLCAWIIDIALHSWLEGMGRVRPTMIINLILLLINIPLDYALVLGKWGLPALGGVGCGWATAILCWVSLLCTLTYMFINSDMSKYLKHLVSLPKWEPTKQILLIGIPIGLAMTAEEGFISIIVLIAAPLGADALGGLQVIASYMMLIVVISAGLGQSITIRIAHALGSGDMASAQFSSYQGIVWISIIMGLACVLGMMVSEPLISLFSEDPKIKALALGLMWLTPLAILPDALLQGFNGTLRAFKDTMIPMLLLVFAYWGVGVPLAYLTIYQDLVMEPLGIIGCYLGYIAGFSVGAVFLGFRLMNVLNKNK